MSMSALYITLEHYVKGKSTIYIEQKSPYSFMDLSSQMGKYSVLTMRVYGFALKPKAGITYTYILHFNSLLLTYSSGVLCMLPCS